eukprot:477420_1
MTGSITASMSYLMETRYIQENVGMIVSSQYSLFAEPTMFNRHFPWLPVPAAKLLSNTFKTNKNSNIYDGYIFKLIAYKTRITKYHCKDEISSIKFIYDIYNKNKNGNHFYYRIWKGDGQYNKYILVHKCKYVTNQQSLLTYLNAFNYEIIKNNDDKIKIQIYFQCDHLLKEAMPIIVKLITSDNVKRYRDNFNANCTCILPSIPYRDNFILPSKYFSQRKNRIHDDINTNYVNNEFLEVFPLSDVETESEWRLSICSGDTSHTVEQIHFTQINNWLDSYDIHIIPSPWICEEIYNSTENKNDLNQKLVDFVWDLFYIAFKEDIFFNKLKKITQNNCNRDLYKIHSVIYFEKIFTFTVRKPYILAVQSCLPGIATNICDIIVCYAAVFTINLNDLKKKRSQFWQTKVKDFNQRIGNETICDEIREGTITLGKHNNFQTFNFRRTQKDMTKKNMKLHDAVNKLLNQECIEFVKCKYLTMYIEALRYHARVSYFREGFNDAKINKGDLLSSFNVFDVKTKEDYTEYLLRIPSCYGYGYKPFFDNYVIKTKHRKMMKLNFKCFHKYFKHQNKSSSR